MHDVIVAGGGVIGLSIARELATHGKSVLVLDRGGASNEPTSWAAAGMLAPQSEASQPDAFFHLCAASLRMYRAWADHLRQQTGVDPEYADPGLLYLAASDDALDRLKARLKWQRDAGLAAELLRPEDVRHIEPNVTMQVAGAALLPAEHQVTPRQLLKALQAGCVGKGVDIRVGGRVQEVLHRGGKLEGVLVDGKQISAPCVVIASGVWSPEIAGLNPLPPVHPRKGQILSLAAPGLSFHHMIRWEHAYIVPRRAGEVIVGATDEAAGFDRNVTAAGVSKLLGEAQRVSSHIGSWPVKEMWTGLRPATPDGLPIIGRSAIDGLIYATGHFRNGILLAPITASIVAALVENRSPAMSLEPYSPNRFSAQITEPRSGDQFASPRL